MTRTAPARTAPTIRSGAVASRRPPGQAASIVILALAALVGLLVARPGAAIADAGSIAAHPIVEAASTAAAPVVAPVRFGLLDSVPRSVPKVRPGHDTTHVVRGVALPPGWLVATVGLALLVLIGLVSLVEPVQPMVRARAAVRGRGPPVRR